MFDSIYSSTVMPKEIMLVAAAALISGCLYAWLMSFRIHSTKRFFIVISLIPFIVAAIITFVNGNIGAGVAIGGAFALVRFRSAQGSSEELLTILIAMGSGIAFGMGFVTYGIALLIGLSGLFYFLSTMPFFEHKKAPKDQLLRITIPESLEYYDAFDDTFERYLNVYENVGVKTTGMGSMFRLSYRIRLKNLEQEKAFIDELRIKNGNLEIAITPYSDHLNQL
ncbi:MAG: DUF4956 domain-containing protein [Lachnospiraceae bacterium]|nr:DUF4956 domain-containing protein [Lachnospiraceae bacterium]